jgi:hypothetical protein
MQVPSRQCRTGQNTADVATVATEVRACSRKRHGEVAAEWRQLAASLLAPLRRIPDLQGRAAMQHRPRAGLHVSFKPSRLHRLGARQTDLIIITI